MAPAFTLAIGWRAGALSGPASIMSLRLYTLGRRDSDRTFRTLSGPFKGMRYYPISTGGEFLPKVTGTYERELHEAIEDLCQDPI